MKRVTLILAAGLVLLAATALPILRAGAQTAVVTDDNLSESIANAKTPADHEAIAAYYDQEAASAEAKGALHPKAASNAKPVGMANMCNGLAQYWGKVATEDKDLAKAHRAMAKGAGREVDN
jgi:hypothetical protein